MARVVDVRLAFLCVANSARSILAEALARHMLGPAVTVVSAGSCPSTVNPLAIRALAEIGIDTTGLSSKGIDSVDIANVDFVITLCADEVCPTSHPGVRHLHWPLIDPAAVQGDEIGKLEAFRRVRDEIRHRLQAFQSTHAF